MGLVSAIAIYLILRGKRQWILNAVVQTTHNGGQREIQNSFDQPLAKILASIILTNVSWARPSLTKFASQDPAPPAEAALFLACIFPSRAQQLPAHFFPVCLHCWLPIRPAAPEFSAELAFLVQLLPQAHPILPARANAPRLAMSLRQSRKQRWASRRNSHNPHMGLKSCGSTL